jgi:phosphopantetheine--protein transferase-like protein
MIGGDSVIGIDLVFVPEFDRQRALGDDAFLRRVFSTTELENLESAHLAGLWAAKEAVIKACAQIGASLVEVVLSHDEAGRPHARYDGRAFEVSIAHHGEYAVAVALMVE